MEGQNNHTLIFDIEEPINKKRTQFIMTRGTDDNRSLHLWKSCDEMDINELMDYGQYISPFPTPFHETFNLFHYMTGKPKKDVMAEVGREMEEENHQDTNEGNEDVVTLSPYRGGIYGSNGANTGVYCLRPYTHWSPPLRQMLWAKNDEWNQDDDVEFDTNLCHKSFKIYQYMYNRDTKEVESRPSNWVWYSDWDHPGYSHTFIVYYPMWERIEEWKHDVPVGLIKLRNLLKTSEHRALDRLYAPTIGIGYNRAKRNFEQLS